MLQLLPNIRTQHCRMQKKNQQDSQNKPQKLREPNKSFHQYMKKDKKLLNKNIHSNNSSGKPLPNNSNYSRHQSPNNPNYRVQSPNFTKFLTKQI